MKIGDDSLCVSQEEQGGVVSMRLEWEPFHYNLYFRPISHEMKDVGKI